MGKRLLWGVPITFSCLALVGLGLAWIAARTLAPGPGWDAVATALGGLLVGGLLGLLVGVVLSWQLPEDRLWQPGLALPGLLAVLVVVAVGADSITAAPASTLELPPRPASAGSEQTIASPGSMAGLVDRLTTRGEVEIDEPALARIATNGLAGAPDGSVFLDAAEPLSARIGDGRIALSTSVDLDRVDTNRLSEDAREVVEGLRQYVPGFGDGPVAVTVSAVPTVDDGALALGQDASFRAGPLVLPSFMLATLGVDEELRRSMRLQIPGVEITEAEIRGDRLRLRAR